MPFSEDDRALIKKLHLFSVSSWHWELLRCRCQSNASRVAAYWQLPLRYVRLRDSWQSHNTQTLSSHAAIIMPVTSDTTTPYTSNALTTVTTVDTECLQDAPLSQRDCAAGCVSFGQQWKIGTRTQYFTDIIVYL